MKRLMFILMVSACLTGFSCLSAMALTLEVQPASQDVLLGDIFSVDLLISDLGDHMADSLGTFDITLLFDPSIISVDETDSDSDSVIDSVNLDPSSQLDIYGYGLNWVSASITSPGQLNLYDVSVDNESDLNDYQDDSFVLAEIAFNTAGIGTSQISFYTNSLTLGDAAGNSITPTVLTNGSVTVRAPAPVPEPATILLLGAGLAGVFGVKRRSSIQQK